MRTRSLAIGLTLCLGIAALGAPATAISDAGCKGLEKSRGFIKIDLRGSALDELFADINEAIPGDGGPPQKAIYVPRVQLRKECGLQ